MKIPPFVRIDLFQIVLTQALSLGNPAFSSHSVIRFSWLTGLHTRVCGIETKNLLDVWV